jgi:hypothetical protein
MSDTCDSLLSDHYTIIYSSEYAIELPVDIYGQ